MGTTRSFLYMSAGVSLSKLLGVACTFLIAKFILPADFGLWTTITVVISYSTISTLGAIETLVKKYPLLVSSNQPVAASRLEQTVLFSVALSSAFVLLSGFAIAAFAFEGPIRQVVASSSIVAATFLFSEYFYFRLSAHQRFLYVSSIESFRAVSRFAILVPLSWKFGLAGLVVGLAVNEGIVCTLAFLLNLKSGGFGPFVRPQGKALLDAIRNGLPITMVWWLLMLFNTTDRMVSMWCLGRTATGYYALGTSIASAITMIPLALGRVLYPRISEQIGKNVSPATLGLLVLKPTQILSLFLALGIGMIVCMLPLVYLQLLPKYSPGLVSAQILMVACYFLSLPRNGVNYLIATNRETELLVLLTFGILFAVLSCAVLAKTGLNIAGIALGTLAGSLLLSTMIWHRVLLSIGVSVSDQVKELFLLYVPLLLSLVACAVSISVGSLYAESRVVSTLLSEAVFVLCYFGMLSIPSPLNTWARLALKKILGPVLPK